MNQNSGIKNLEMLKTALNPLLCPQKYVFVHLKSARYGDLASLYPWATITEDQGLSMIIERTVAVERQLEFDGVFKRISLGVHSSLHAVGLTAFISELLAREGIPANIVAGTFNDHLFVPEAFAERAFSLLQGA